jgi:hypothetical protein
LHQKSWEIQDGDFVGETFDPDDVEGFNHVQENRAS